GDLFAKRTNGDIANIHGIDANGAGSQFVEARQEIYQGGLPRAARTDQSNDFSLVCRKADVFEDYRRAVFVGKAHVVKFDELRKRGKDVCTGQFELFFHAIQVGKHLHARSLRGLELLIDVAHALERHIRTKQSID